MQRLYLLGLVLASCSFAGSAWALANPATTFCVEMGGKPEMVTEAGGGVMGLCHLPDGRIVEEWTLFRLYQGKVPQPGTKTPAAGN